jgi:hypothetical protein
MGKTFPDDYERKVDRLKYQIAIAAALKRELGGSHRAIKNVMRWTGVSERTAKKWLAGFHGPAGEHLVELMRNSNEVLTAVLSLAGRGELKIGAGSKLRHLFPSSTKSCDHALDNLMIQQCRVHTSGQHVEG